MYSYELIGSFVCLPGEVSFVYCYFQSELKKHPNRQKFQYILGGNCIWYLRHEKFTLIWNIDFDRLIGCCLLFYCNQEDLLQCTIRRREISTP